MSPAPPLDNAAVAERLEEIAELLEAQNANPYRVRSYRVAAETIRNLPEEVDSLMEASGQEGLLALPGIGSSLARSIEGLTHTGHVGLLDRLRGDVKTEDVLTTVPTIGPELARRVHDQLGIESLRLPRGFRCGPSGRRALQALAKRFPGQGHLDYLLAQDARTEDERRELLRHCLHKTPFHRSALAELAALGERDAASVLARLTPEHPRSTRFGDLVSLAGFDLGRGDSEVYLTLYWEAEAVSAQTFSGKLAASMIVAS